MTARDSLRHSPEGALRVLHSVRFRLMIWSLAMMALVLLAFSLFVYSRQQADLATLDQASLAKSLDYFQTYFKSSGLLYDNTDGRLIAPGTVFNLPPMPPPGIKEMRAIIAPDGQVIWSQGEFDPQLLAKFLMPSPEGALRVKQAAQVDPSGKAVQFSNYLQGQPAYSFMSVVFPTVQGEKGALVVGIATNVNQRLSSLALSLLAGSLVVLLATLAGGYWIAGRVMRPVQDITRVARQIGESDLRRRIGLKNDDELGELASTFDQMLARLEASFDRQQQFTADASHELRTPLTIIELESERTLENPSTLEEYQRAMRVVRSENEAMIRLVEDLLTLARLDTGKSIFKMEPLDLSDLALEVVGRLAPLAESQNVNLITGDLPPVKVTGDPAALARAFGNLVENAIKFTGGSQRSVKVETGVGEENGQRWGWVAVSDTGPGIPTGNLAHIFDRFYQIDKIRGRGKTGRLKEGSGLGLSIVQSIIRAHQGTVQITSAAGQGSRFEMRLNLA